MKNLSPIVASLILFGVIPGLGLIIAKFLWLYFVAPDRLDGEFVGSSVFLFLVFLAIGYGSAIFASKRRNEDKD